MFSEVHFHSPVSPCPHWAEACLDILRTEASSQLVDSVPKHTPCWIAHAQGERASFPSPAPLVYATRRTLRTPSLSSRTEKGNCAVVIIGVGRDGGGRDDGPSTAENGVTFVMTLRKVG